MLLEFISRMCMLQSRGVAFSVGLSSPADQWTKKRSRKGEWLLTMSRARWGVQAAKMMRAAQRSNSAQHPQSQSVRRPPK